MSDSEYEYEEEVIAIGWFALLDLISNFSLAMLHLTWERPLQAILLNKRRAQGAVLW